LLEHVPPEQDSLNSAPFKVVISRNRYKRMPQHGGTVTVIVGGLHEHF
jgi:hypothetical protein